MYCLFWNQLAWGIWVPWSGIKPVLLHWRCSHWTAMEAPVSCFCYHHNGRRKWWQDTEYDWVDQGSTRDEGYSLACSLKLQAAPEEISCLSLSKLLDSRAQVLWTIHFGSSKCFEAIRWWEPREFQWPFRAYPWENWTISCMGRVMRSQVANCFFPL